MILFHLAESVFVNKSSLKVKILLTIVTLTLMSLGVFSYLTFNSYKKDKLAFVYDHLASEAQYNAMLIKSTLESYDFFLGAIIPGIDATTRKLPLMTEKFLETKPNVLGLYYHVPGMSDYSELTLHQAKGEGVAEVGWEEINKHGLGFTVLDGKSGLFLIKKSLSVENSFAAVVFKSPELVDTIRSSSGRYNFVLKNTKVLSREELDIEKIDMSSIKTSIKGMKSSFGLFEVKVKGENHIASYSKLPFENMVLVHLIRESKVMLIQQVFLKQVVIFLVLMGSISLFIGTLSARWLTIQLDDLTYASQELENENFEYQVIVTSGDELGTLGNAFNSMSSKIRVLLEELRRYNAELEEMVAERTKELQHLSEIQDAMLNSLGQGFVIVDKDHKILPIYSKAAVEMFETIPNESKPAQILGIKQEEEANYREFYDLVFNRTLEFDDLAKMNPEMRSNSKDQKIQLTYASIRNTESHELDYVLVIGTDKTKEIENMEKFKKEWNFSQMMMKISSNRHSLNKVLAESLRMLDECLNVLEEDKTYGMRDVQRYVHTIKGSFSYFNIEEVTKLTNDVEQFLTPHFNTPKPSMDLRLAILEKISEIQIAIECYIDKYDQVIQFKKSAKVKTIPIEDLSQFAEILASKDKTLFAAFKRTFYFNEIAPFFQMYPGIVSDLSTKLGKKIRFKMVGEQVHLPEGPWDELFGQFIHFIRNSADHGIESEKERVAKGKDPTGQITFAFELNDTQLLIRLSDDGGGVDWQKIAAKDPEVKCEEDALKRILLGGVSSKDEVSEVSGRGVGVSAITSVVQGWGGEINVKNQLGSSFTIFITIPLTTGRLKSVA